MPVLCSRLYSYARLTRLYSSICISPVAGYWLHWGVYFLSAIDELPHLQIADVSAVAGGIALLMMLTVQQFVFSVLEKTPAKSIAEIKVVGESIDYGPCNVQLGMDIAFDLPIRTATTVE